MRRTSSSKVIMWSQHRTVKLAIATHLKCNDISDVDTKSVNNESQTYDSSLTIISRKWFVKTCNATRQCRYLRLEWIQGHRSRGHSIHSWQSSESVKTERDLQMLLISDLCTSAGNILYPQRTLPSKDNGWAYAWIRLWLVQELLWIHETLITSP